MNEIVFSYVKESDKSMEKEEYPVVDVSE